MEKSGMKFELNAYTPFGFVQSADFPEVLRPYEEHVVLIRKIFELCVKGWSLGQITEYVNSTDISYRAKYEKNMKVMWSRAEIKKILQNNIYVNGTYRIVGKRQFEMAGRMLEINTRATERNSEVSPLVGLAKCYECGNWLAERSKSSRGRKYLYYMCGLNKRNGECTPHKIITSELNERILKWLKNCVFEEEVQNAVKLTRELAIKYVDRVWIDDGGMVVSGDLV